MDNWGINLWEGLWGVFEEGLWDYSIAYWWKGLWNNMDIIWI